MADKDLTPNQIDIIQMGIRVGRMIQRDYPEVADLYRQGAYLPEIFEKLGLEEKYDITEGVGLSALSYAIGGHIGYFGIESYEGLISDASERERLATEHRSSNGRRVLEQRTLEERRFAGLRGGSSARDKKSGIHAQSREERLYNCSRGGSSARDKKSGIHGMNEQELSAAGKRSAQLRGLVTWSRREKIRAYVSSQLPEYYYPEGSSNAGKPNYVAIAEDLNKVFHGGNSVRNNRSVGSLLFRYASSFDE